MGLKQFYSAPPLETEPSASGLHPGCATRMQAGGGGGGGQHVDAKNGFLSTTALVSKPWEIHSQEIGSRHPEVSAPVLIMLFRVNYLRHSVSCSP